MFNTAPFVWAVSHFSYIGWPTFIFACYRVFRFFYKLGCSVTLLIQRVLKGEETIQLMAVNHLPHIQAALEDINAKTEQTNEILRALRDDLQDVRVR